MRFAIILGTLIIGFAIFGFATYKAMNTLNVNGPIYQRIVQGKDIIADVLPPPEYIIESYLVALQLAQVETPAQTSTLVARFQTLKTEYETRHSYWLAQSLEQELHTPLLETAYQAAQTFYTEANQHYLPSIQAGDHEGSKSSILKMYNAYEAHRAAIDEVVKLTTARNLEDESLAQNTIHKYKVVMTGIFIFSVVLAVLLTVRISRGILRSLKTVQLVAGAIAEGDLNSTIDTSEKDELGDLLRSMKTMQQQLLERITKDSKLADKNLRIKIALDNVSGGIIIADNNRNIIYVNKSAVKILKKAEADIRKDLPNFSTDNLLGSCFDIYHKNPAHQAQLLSTLSSSIVSCMILGGHSIVVTGTPVINDHGERVGAVAEWKDRTDEVAVEKELSDFVSAATMGDFSKRFNLQGKKGFFRELGEALNQLLYSSETGLNEVVRVLNALSRGDLTETIVNNYSGTFEQLKNDSNTTVEKLKDIIYQIKEAAESINIGANEIASGNNDLSHRTEEQASSLEQTAASMEELTSAVQHNAKNAQHANQLAVDASVIAGKGVEVVEQVVTTMNDINESSRKIGDIISVIDDIAFQTNILALNAAVEAARAGEQGRGFAVVAVEVRNLAQRAATAAGEIKILINDSVVKVSGGSKLVAQAGQTMEAIVSSIRGVTDVMSEITTASSEQSSGIEQVNQAIAQMDDVTQQNAALVEQAAAAAESLEEQAQNLVKIVSGFKVDNKSSFHAKPIQKHTSLARADLSKKLSAQPKPKLQSTDDDNWEEF
jgi:methyl-accepting chemotaxis protein